MAEDLVLLDSNILLRGLQPLDPSFQPIKAAIDDLAKAGAVLCYKRILTLDAGGFTRFHHIVALHPDKMCLIS